jgi:hypothetical protein
MVFGLALVAGVVGLTLSLSSGAALADGGEHHHDQHQHSSADVTFTKWLVSAAGGMEGVVGGDVGTGTYAGQILSLVDDGTTTAIVADYHINGRKHSLTARVNVAQSDATGVAAITGVVTKGWLKGARLTGEYTVMPVCPIATPGNVLGTLCFQGTLHIERGSKH